MLTTIREALRVGPASREQWIRERCRYDEELTQSLVLMTQRADKAGGPDLLPSGGALKGPLWERLAETLNPNEGLSSGSQVGRFVVLEAIGAGGMGAVYSAWDPELDRKVALKLLHPDPSNSQEAESRLRREAQALARLSHENVITVHDVGRWNGRVFIAMEFIDGEDLASWRKAGPHDWRETLDIYIRAGRGLAAAHDAGLVHRDFKPQNVLRSRDGKVRVVDFGLARSVEGSAGSPGSGTHEADSAPLGTAAPLLAVTRAGSIAGTPAFMAPEQFEGLDPDPRSDQFGFCVSLYQALWGELPFAVDSIYDLNQLYKENGTPKAPALPKLPRWLQTTILRGLAIDPEDRWPDMDSLLDALQRGSSRRVSGWLVAGSVGLLLVLWMSFRTTGESLCQSAGARVATVWSEDQRDRLGSVFDTTDGTSAGLFERTLAVLNAYAGQWTEARTEACEATHVHGDQSGELLDLRMACLDRRLAEFSAVVDLLTDGDHEVLSRAPDIALGLEPLAICADTQLLRAPIERPQEPGRHRKLEDLESRLARVKASVEAGRLVETRQQAESLVKDAESFGFAPFTAEARWTLADVAERSGEFDLSADEAFASWTAAERGGHDEYRLRALSLLVWIDGNDRARPEEAERWARLGEATLGHLGSGGLLQAELDSNIGAALQTAGRTEEALEHHLRALDLRTRFLGPESYAVAKSLNNIGSVYFVSARFQDALDHYRRALVLTEGTLGPHASTALAWSNVGATLIELEQADEARAANQRALAMRQELLGNDSLWVGFSQVNIALSYLIDEPESARGPLDEASRILAVALPVDHPYQAFLISAQGAYLEATGHPDEAIPLLEKAIATWEEHGIASPYEVAGDRFALARAVWHLDPERSLAIVEDVRAGLLASFQSKTPLSEDIDQWVEQHSEPQVASPNSSS
ncbi:MAG: serine/threonine-protein kinase [Thermoanaerobaculia bacterium]|nr:serine/threonine-protein kinase [Thermoanaerobaculia bacterium]